MKKYTLYWIRAITLGAGLNFLMTGYLMNNHKMKFEHAMPLSAFVCINLSYAADRIIFGEKKPKEIKELPPISTPHCCPICSDYPCACDS